MFACVQTCLSICTCMVKTDQSLCMHKDSPLQGSPVFSSSSDNAPVSLSSCLVAAHIHFITNKSFQNYV